jgi:hypothetical protein
MRQMHVVCTSNKAHKVAFGIQRQALWHALCLYVGEQSLQESHLLSVKGSFVVFIPSADRICCMWPLHALVVAPSARRASHVSGKNIRAGLMDVLVRLLVPTDGILRE